MSVHNIASIWYSGPVGRYPPSMTDYTRVSDTIQWLVKTMQDDEDTCPGG